MGVYFVAPPFNFIVMGVFDGLIGGLLGSVGSIIQNDSNQSFARSQATQQQNWQERMFWNQVNVNRDVFAAQNGEWRNRMKISDQYAKDMQDWLYQNYNSPSAVAAALRKAGYNPSVLLGNSQSPFGSQSAPASFSPGEPSMNSANPGSVSLPGFHAENPLGGLAQGIQSLSEIARNYAAAGREGAQANEINKMLDEKVRGLLLRNNYQEIENDRSAFLLSLDKMNLDKKQKAEIEDLVNSASMKLALGRGADAKADLDAATTKLAEQKFDINQPYAQNAMFCFRLYTDSMQASINQAKSSAFNNYQQGLLAKEEATTEDATRPGKITLLEYDNQLRKIQKELTRAQINEIKAKTGLSEQQFKEGLREAMMAEDQAAFWQEHPTLRWAVSITKNASESFWSFISGNGSLLKGVLK